MKKLAVIACTLALVACGGASSKSGESKSGESKETLSNAEVSGVSSKRVFGNLNQLKVSGTGHIVCAGRVNYLRLSGVGNKVYADVKGQDISGVDNRIYSSNDCPIQQSKPQKQTELDKLPFFKPDLAPYVMVENSKALEITGKSASKMFFKNAESLKLIGAVENLICVQHVGAISIDKDSKYNLIAADTVRSLFISGRYNRVYLKKLFSTFSIEGIGNSQQGYTYEKGIFQSVHIL